MGDAFTHALLTLIHNIKPPVLLLPIGWRKYALI